MKYLISLIYTQTLSTYSIPVLFKSRIISLQVFITLFTQNIFLFFIQILFMQHIFVLLTKLSQPLCDNTQQLQYLELLLFQNINQSHVLNYLNHYFLTILHTYHFIQQGSNNLNTSNVKNDFYENVNNKILTTILLTQILRDQNYCYLCFELFEHFIVINLKIALVNSKKDRYRERNFLKACQFLIFFLKLQLIYIRQKNQACIILFYIQKIYINTYILNLNYFQSKQDNSKLYIYKILKFILLLIKQLLQQLLQLGFYYYFFVLKLNIYSRRQKYITILYLLYQFILILSQISFTYFIINLYAIIMHIQIINIFQIFRFKLQFNQPNKPTSNLNLIFQQSHQKKYYVLNMIKIFRIDTYINKYIYTLNS
eukprot:TRINITY_DN1237_c0_g1_i6.p1 TRINITY_DN1237_c0_g1~~TRINITY_DN1237_c0_g1_i6.p1  ORF type:complete len:370 (-),score=-41.58 TRINITY_DN1237_c0_g1_i6:377-1486(-)